MKERKRRRHVKTEGLSPLHARFVAEYLIDLNATQAYRRADARCRSDNSAGVRGWKLLRNPKIMEAVAAGQATRLASAELSATRVLEEARRLLLYNARDFFCDDGSLKPLSELTEAQAAVIEGMKVARANFDRTDGKKSDEWLHEIKLPKKAPVLDLLMRHFKLLTDVLEVKGVEDLEQRIEATRRSLAEHKGRVAR